jgi:replicative DNA helicase
MVSKSVARYTFVKDPERAVTALSIRKGYLPRHVMDAARVYKKDVEKRVNIIEGNFNCDLDYIRNYIRNYIQRNNVRPVVFLDYLQIVKPGINDRGYTQSTKETVDEVVTALKRLSREMGLSIIVISSVNRANYLTQIDFESLKESGGIEYSADVVWGLQLQVLSEDVFLKEQQSSINIRRQKVQEAKSETPRRIELRCLKNRYGIANYSCYFEYFPANDYFQPQGEDEAEYRPQLTAGRTLDRRRTR